MTPFSSRTPLFTVLSALILMAMFGTSAYAQAEVIMRCGVEHERDVLPDPFPGVYYYNSIRDNNYAFERLSNSGVQDLAAPFDTYQQNTLNLPSVSPNEKLMVFRPFSENTELTVWDIESDELATITLTEQERTFSHNTFPYALYQKKLVWQNNDQIILRLFNEHEQEIFEAAFSISRNPLQITRLSSGAVNYPSFPMPESTVPPITYLSPTGNYAVVVGRQVVYGEGDLPHLQVYELVNNQLLFDFPPVGDVYISGPPVWSPEEDELWVTQANRDKRNRTFIRINLTDNSVTNINEDILDNLLGFQTNVITAIEPTFSPDGQHVFFSIFGDGDVLHHNIVYPLDGNEAIVAICDNFELSGEYLYPFWSPDNRYIGYWNGGVVHALDTQTGEVFRLPNEGGGFIGWIQDE